MEPVSNADKLAEIRKRMQLIYGLETKLMVSGPATSERIIKQQTEIQEFYYDDIDFLVSEIDRLKERDKQLPISEKELHFLFKLLLNTNHNDELRNTLFSKVEKMYFDIGVGEETK